MLTSLVYQLAAGIGAMASAIGRRRSRRAFDPMLSFDDHLLRDIGLTRNDVIDVLTSPADDDPVDFLAARRKHNAVADCPADADRRLAA
jgi:uncharacterized protein YjiS (DUF1127 family)